MTATILLAGLGIAVGLVGIVLPGVPGSLLVGASIGVWALDESSPTGWTVLAVCVALLLVGIVVKYAVPGRRLKRHGTPVSTLLAGAVLGVVGFFVIPVVGLVVGFVLGIYLAELRRLGGHQRARSATVAALRALGLSLLIELVASLAAAGVWAAGLLLV